MMLMIFELSICHCTYYHLLLVYLLLDEMNSSLLLSLSTLTTTLCPLLSIYSHVFPTKLRRIGLMWGLLSILILPVMQKLQYIV
jgi:hypothetical protein